MCHQCFNKSESRADQCRSLEGTWLAADSRFCESAFWITYFLHSLIIGDDLEAHLEPSRHPLHMVPP